MVGDCGRRERHPEAKHPKAPAEIYVLEEGKIIGIEAADVKEDLAIYQLGTRLFMVMEVNEQFSLEAKAKADRENPKVQEWEKLMWKFQKPLPEAKPGEKWLLMERIFKLEK